MRPFQRLLTMVPPQPAHGTNQHYQPSAYRHAATATLQRVPLARARTEVAGRISGASSMARSPSWCGSPQKHELLLVFFLFLAQLRGGHHVQKA
jgi:hypothetical protein